MTKFVPSLALSRMLYEEQIEPILEMGFPGLPYAAATLGMCSEILGLDDAVSMDHEWGPRVTVFLSDEAYGQHAEALMQGFRDFLPKSFKGFDMMWRKPGVDVHDTKETILYHVGVSTIDRALGFCGGSAALPLQDTNWLKISEQHLLEFTSGVVYHDATGDLTAARDALAYYPDDVLRFLLLNEWNALGGDWFPVGRIGARGDALGLRLQAARIAQHLMRIAFRVSQRYWTYRKWFGTLFKQLPIAGELEPLLSVLVDEKNWRRIEETIGEAAAILLSEQSKLGIAPPVHFLMDRSDDPRHHMKYDFGVVGRELTRSLSPALKSLMNNQVYWLHERSLILWNEEVGKWTWLLQK